jgi:hypothetical protein
MQCLRRLLLLPRLPVPQRLFLHAACIQPCHARSLSVHPLRSSLPRHLGSRAAFPSLLPRPSPSALHSLHRIYLVNDRSFASGRRGGGASSTRSVAPSTSAASSPFSYTDSSRLLFSTTLTRYARGVPYLYLFFLLPVVCFVVYVTYPASSLSSPMTLLPLTVLPLSFVLIFAVFARFNRRLVSSIHLLPHRRLALRTVGMWQQSEAIVRPLDRLIAPFAWSGAGDKALERLQFVTEDGGVERFYIYPMPNKAEDEDAELLTRILTHNRIDNKELSM